MSKRDNSARMDRDAYFKSTKPNGPLAVKVGDEVAYARYFLRSIGIPPTDDMWRARGVVTEVVAGQPVTRLCKVSWDGEEPQGILTCNLAFPGPNLRFCE